MGSESAHISRTGQDVYSDSVVSLAGEVHNESSRWGAHTLASWPSREARGGLRGAPTRLGTISNISVRPVSIRPSRRAVHLIVTDTLQPTRNSSAGGSMRLKVLATDRRVEKTICSIEFLKKLLRPIQCTYFIF